MGYWIWSIYRICILRWTLPWWCWKLVALFGSSFPVFKLLLPLMKYGMGIRCTKTLSVSMFCSSAWVGGRPPAQGSQIVFWGIVRVSFCYRFFPVTFHKKMSANTYHYSNPCLKQSKNKRIHVYYILHTGINKVAVLAILTLFLCPFFCALKCLISPAHCDECRVSLLKASKLPIDLSPISHLKG